MKFRDYMNKLLAEAEEEDQKKETEQNDAKLNKTREEMINLFSNNDASEDDINSLSSSLGVKKDEIHKILYKLMSEFFGSGRYVDAVKSGNPPDIDDAQLKKGIETEMEHTTSAIFAKKIALDHLTEDSEYYTKLENMEGGE